MKQSLYRDNTAAMVMLHKTEEEEEEEVDVAAAQAERMARNRAWRARRAGEDGRAVDPAERRQLARSQARQWEKQLQAALFCSACRSSLLFYTICTAQSIQKMFL